MGKGKKSETKLNAVSLMGKVNFTSGREGIMRSREIPSGEYPGRDGKIGTARREWDKASKGNFGEKGGESKVRASKKKGEIEGKTGRWGRLSKWGKHGRAPK